MTFRSYGTTLRFFSAPVFGAKKSANCRAEFCSEGRRGHSARWHRPPPPGHHSLLSSGSCEPPRASKRSSRCLSAGSGSREIRGVLPKILIFLGLVQSLWLWLWLKCSFFLEPKRKWLCGKHHSAQPFCDLPIGRHFATYSSQCWKREISKGPSSQPTSSYWISILRGCSETPHKGRKMVRL